MDKRHIIEDAEFDISFDSAVAAREHEPGLAAFITERLLPLADEIFCELADDGMVARIDRLEIDLGAIRSSGFRDEMEIRFREKLRALLLEKMRSLPASHSSAEGRVSRRQAELGRLGTFLESGRMPWHAENAAGVTVDAILEKTLRHQDEAFAEFLRRTPHRDVVVKRLARQFPDRLLVGVLRSLAPLHAAILGELIGKLGETWKMESPGMTEREFKSLVWERLLGEHLKSGVSDPERLLGEIAKDLFARYAPSGDVPVGNDSSTGGLPGRKSKDDARELGEAGEGARDVGRVDALLAASAAKQSEASSEWRSNIAHQRALLETAFATGEAGELAGLWEALCSEHRELLREVFMQRMGDDRLQKKLADGFPESMLRDLLNILSPQDGGFMLALSDLPELRGTAGEKNAEFWNYTLGYLHGAQVYGREEYARGLVNCMSMYGGAQRLLVQALVGVAPELKEVLSCLPEVSATDTEPSAGEPERAAELYRRVIHRLSGASGEPELAALVEELANVYPETLAHLLRQLQSGELHADAGRLDATEARKLAVSMIRLNTDAKESDLLRAVAAQAQRARDPLRYYRHILDRLIRNEVVDLEAAADESSPGNEVVRQTMPPTGDAPQEMDAAKARIARLRRVLDGALTGGSAAELVSVWDELRRDHPALVRECFVRLLGDEGARGRVAQGFPASMLAELARILVPAESRFIETLAAQLRSGSTGIAGVRSALLWKYTLGYLHATPAFDRRDYAENLLHYLGAQGISPHEILQALAHADAELGKVLSERQGMRADLQQQSASTAEAERADELYRQLVLRLSGESGGERDMVKTIKELASAYPETLALLQRRLQAGELRADVGTLAVREARQLVRSLVRLNSGARDSDFLRAIERYAGRAKSGTGYYLHILESLIHNRTIDLEDAVRSPVHWDRQPDVQDDSGMAAGNSIAPADDETVNAESALETVELLRIRLGEALALGRAESVEGIWGGLLSGHADMLRQVFMRRLGDERMRSRLANGFPESMLQELVCALAPSAGRDIGTLATQPELRASGTPDAKNIPFWEYTLSYLHSSGLREYVWPEYAEGLVHRLVELGQSRTDLLQAIARIAPAWGTAISGPERGIGSVPTDVRHDAEDMSAGTMRDGESIERHRPSDPHRLIDSDRLRASVREISALADGEPEAVREFYRQLQLGEAALDVTVLTAREARLLIAAFIAANHGGMGEDIRREIEAHAGKARDERRYYQTILEMLIRSRVLDIEEAMAALPNEATGEEGHPVRAGADEKAVSGIGALRNRFESALVQGDAGEISGVWNDLRFNYGNLVREVFNLRMGDDVLRKKLVQRFPEAMLFELIRVLAPLAGGFIESLERQLGLQVGTEKAEAVRRTVREHALFHIHAFGARGFRRTDYARDLMNRMAAQGVDGSDFLQAAAAIDSALAQSLPGQDAMIARPSQPMPQTETAQVEERYEQLVRRLSRQVGSEDGARDFSREIGELAAVHPETLERLYRSLQTGELELDALPLTASEAGKLTEFFAGLTQDRDVQRKIEKYAGSAKDERSYYRNILEKLVRNQTVDFEVAMNKAQRTPERIARLHALLANAFATGDADALSGQWDELRSEHRELVRAIFMQCMGDDKLQKKLAERFPEIMLVELLNILSPQDSGFMFALSGLPELRGSASAKIVAFWNYTLAFLHGSPRGSRAEYARGLIRYMSAQGIARRPLAQALVGISPELKEAFVDLPEMSATDAADRAGESVRADELYLRLVKRLSGAGGGEQEFIEMLNALEKTSPETHVHLLRQLQRGEIRMDVGTLAMSVARQLAIALIRLNPGAQDLLQAIGAQEHRAEDAEGYYRHVLEKLIRNQSADIEAEAADEVVSSSDSTQQTARQSADAVRDEEIMQTRDAARTPDEATAPARAAYLRTLLDAALSAGYAGELAGDWDELRQHHPSLVCERFAQLMGDERARGRVAQGFPESMLAELVRVLVPAESRFIEALVAQLQPGQKASNNNRFLWQHTLGYLHATRNFDRRDYAESLMRYLHERGADRNEILQAVAHADARLGKVLSEREDMHAHAQEQIVRQTEVERADESYRQLVLRLSGTRDGRDMVPAIEKLASAYPEKLMRLQRSVQAGELRADVGTLDTREAREMVTVLIRLSSGTQDSEFLRSVERYAGQAQSEVAYYRHILESLFRSRNIDLEEAASAVPQEMARHMSADVGSEENRASPGATSGGEQRTQMIEGVRPQVTTGDKAMQVEHTSVFDGHGAMDDSESAEEIYIANAGMVLATPYLPQLFRMLDLTEGAKFRDERSAERAIHLLQFMVNESCDSPEFLLSLNKLLCGVSTGVPIVREIELLQREREAIEGMLNGIIRNWTSLGNTSVQGLRESFLQRSGRLQLKEDNWHLKVETKGIDVLLDRLPWSFALIKHPWMRRPIYVEWR
ncbi:MAG: contractile injection system tape measure protein [Gallionella sp.]|nr:contractile injection system tape measure protein [Gallionella sp.]